MMTTPVFLNRAAIVLIGSLARETRNKACKETRLFTFMQALQYLRQLRILDALLQLAKKIEELRGIVPVQPGQESIEGFLQRLLGVEPEFDDVARSDCGKIK